MDAPKFKRVLLKLSGEAFLGSRQYGIDPAFTRKLAGEIIDLQKLRIEIALTVGSGNIFRGLSASEHGLDRATGDYMGMLATVMNAMALQDALEKQGVATRVLTALEIKGVAEPYIRRRAIRHMEQGKIVIFGAGTGNPFFTTDMAGALRALEIGCEVLLKGTSVDGVYDKDPKKFPDAKRMTHISYVDALKDENITVMDNSAVSLAMDNKLPIIVFNMYEPGNIKKVVLDPTIGTLIS